MKAVEKGGSKAVLTKKTATHLKRGAHERRTGRDIEVFTCPFLSSLDGSSEAAISDVSYCTVYTVYCTAQPIVLCSGRHCIEDQTARAEEKYMKGLKQLAALRNKKTKGRMVKGRAITIKVFGQPAVGWHWPYQT